MRIALAALLLLMTAPLPAEFEDFGPRRFHVSLFDPPVGESKTEPKTTLQAQPEAIPQAAHLHHADHAGLAFWATPFLRITEDPTGVGAGFGFEFSYMATDRFGMMVSLGIWNINTRIVEDNDDKRVDVTCFDIEVGPRFHALHWRNGRVYMDLRFVISVCDGPAPVRSTVAMGGDMRWGFEFGDDDVRTFIETGMGLRSAVNFGDAGWLEYGVSNGSSGMIFDFLRVGMRLYF